MCGHSSRVSVPLIRRRPVISDRRRHVRRQVVTHNRIEVRVGEMVVMIVVAVVISVSVVIATGQFGDAADVDDVGVAESDVGMIVKRGEALA